MLIDLQEEEEGASRTSTKNHDKKIFLSCFLVEALEALGGMPVQPQPGLEPPALAVTVVGQYSSLSLFPSCTLQAE